ncbi:MAG: hypothetical protein WCF65_04905, partial [Parachlamydiaceae bacterium]
VQVIMAIQKCYLHLNHAIFLLLLKSNELISYGIRNGCVLPYPAHQELDLTIQSFCIMVCDMNTLVMKFGGAAVANPRQFARIADIVLSRRQKYQRIVVVVSAMGDTTDELISLALQVNPEPPRREYDMLVSVGERISISLLAMALAAKQHQAVSFTGSQSGIITCHRHTDARIIDVRPNRLLPVLDNGQVAIVAGFQGVSRKGEITTLGRGGSDTSAVALAVALGATKVEFFKDVPGIFSCDPKENPQAQLLPRLSYDATLDILNKGAEVLQQRSVELARRNGVLLHVLSFQDFDLKTSIQAEESLGTLVGSPDTIRLNHFIYEEEYESPVHTND